MRPTTPMRRRCLTAMLGGTTVLALLGAAGAPAGADTPAAKPHAVPGWAGATGGAAAHARAAATAHASSVTITDQPGNVYDVTPPQTSVPSPTSDPADLISASASDDGTTVTLNARTVAQPNPFADPNWVQNDTYIAWQLDTTGSGTPTYTAYFQVSPNGTPAGELAYEPSDNPVSCTVNLSYDATAGYTATFATRCLPNVTSFRWNVYSFYDTVNGDRGAKAFGKMLPDRFTGGATWAGPVTVAPPVAAAGSSVPTYWLFGQDGGVFSFNAPFLGSVPGAGAHVSDIVGGTTTLDHQGYWMVGSDGGVFAFGDARFYGSMGGTRLNAPIAGMTNEVTGNGYWLVARDGGVFAFGGAGYFGSMGGKPLNSPIVAMTSADDGGYVMVAADGGVFTFGDAGYYGSLPQLGVKPSSPIVGAAATPDGKGYWLVGADGAVYAFGDAPYLGSMGGTPLVQPMVGMVATPDGGGYWLDAADGGVFSYGDTQFYGSLGGHPRTDPVVAMAVAG